MDEGERVKIWGVGHRTARPIMGVWGYRHETRYSQEKTACRYRWRRPGFIYRRCSSHGCRTGWASRSCGRSNVYRPAACRSLGASLVFETLLQELRGEAEAEASFPEGIGFVM